MRRLVSLVVTCVLAATSAARAGTATSVTAEPASAYVGGGVMGGGLDGYESAQGFFDGGLAIAGHWLWLHARLGAGTRSDKEAEPPWSHRIASAVAGVEARGCVRFVCVVSGLDLGGRVDFRDGPLPAVDLHVGLEIGLGDTGVALRVALGLDPGPSGSLGLLVRL